MRAKEILEGGCAHFVQRPSPYFYSLQYPWILSRRMLMRAVFRHKGVKERTTVCSREGGRREDYPEKGPRRCVLISSVAALSVYYFVASFDANPNTLSRGAQQRGVTLVVLETRPLGVEVGRGKRPILKTEEEDGRKRGDNNIYVVGQRESSFRSRSSALCGVKPYVSGASELVVDVAESLGVGLQELS